MNDVKFKQGDMVEWSVPGVLYGYGKVVGLANLGSAVIGPSYIVEDMSGAIPNEVYQYTHLCVFELNMKAK